MSSDQETRAQLVTPGQSPRLSMQHRNVLRYTSAVASVAVHSTSAYEGPDTLILCSTDGLGPPSDPLSEDPSPSNCRFYVEKAVTDGTHEERTITLNFTTDENEGTEEFAATRAPETLSNMKFALFWAPTGKPKKECIEICSYREYEVVWSTGETPSYVAHFISMRFAEAGEATLPGETRPRYDREDPYRTDPGPPPFVGEDPEDEEKETNSSPFAEPLWESATPVKSRPPSGSNSGDGETDLSGPPEPPAGERWIHLFWQREEPTFEKARSLGTYKVTEEGTYKRARYGEEGSPSVEGPSQEQVLLPINAESRPNDLRSTYAYLSSFQIPAKRKNDLRDAISRPGVTETTAALMPLCLRGFDGEGPGLAEVSEGDGDWAYFSSRASNYAGVLTGQDTTPATMRAPEPVMSEDPFLLLPNPLAIAERRVGVAEQAHIRLQEWTEAAHPATARAGLLGAPCFDPSHGRTYLSGTLADPPATDEAPGYDVTTELNWGNFSLREATGNEKAPTQPAGDSALAHFLYGARCQEAYLRAQWRRATEAVDRLIESPLLLRGTVLDARSADGETKNATRTVEQLCGLFPRMTAIGGGEALPRLIEESGLMDPLPTLQPEAWDQMLVPLDAGGEESGRSAVEQPAFKHLFRIAKYSNTAAHQLVQGAAPSVLSWQAEGTVIESYAKQPPKAFVLFSWLLHRATNPDSTSPSEAYTVT